MTKIFECLPDVVPDLCKPFCQQCRAIYRILSLDICLSNCRCKDYDREAHKARLFFAENKAREAKKDIPEKLDIGLINETHDSNRNNVANNGASNGASDIIMSNNGDVEPMIS